MEDNINIKIVNEISNFFMWVQNNMTKELCEEIWSEKEFNYKDWDTGKDINHFWKKWLEDKGNALIFWNRIDIGCKWKLFYTKVVKTDKDFHMIDVELIDEIKNLFLWLNNRFYDICSDLWPNEKDDYWNKWMNEYLNKSFLFWNSLKLDYKEKLLEYFKAKKTW